MAEGAMTVAVDALMVVVTVAHLHAILHVLLSVQANALLGVWVVARHLVLVAVVQDVEIRVPIHVVVEIDYK